MFPIRYFPDRYFTPRYWPKLGQDASPITGDTFLIDLYVSTLMSLDLNKTSAMYLDLYNERTRSFDLEL